MAILAQSTTYTREFKMIDSADHFSKKAGLTCTVNLSKAGGAFGAAAGTVTEIANGWYKIALTTADTGTLGDLAYYITAAGADDTDFCDQVGPPPVNAIQVGGTTLTARDIGASVLLSTGTGTGQLDFTSGVVKANATQWLGGTIPAVNVTGVPLVDLKYTLGTISPAAAGSVGIDWAQVANKGSTVSLTATTIATLTTYTGNTPQTGDNFARLGAPVGASISADIAEIEGETDTLLAGVTVTTNNDKTGYTVSTVSDKTGYALTAGERTSIADALLDRDMSTGVDSGSPTVRTVRNALRFLRNKWSISGATMTVCKEDDTATAWTSTLTTTAGTNPVTTSDPAG